MIAAIPVHRMGEADDVAGATLLTSDKASFVTGADPAVDRDGLELS